MSVSLALACLAILATGVEAQSVPKAAGSPSPQTKAASGNPTPQTPLQEAQALLAKVTALRDADESATNADERRALLEQADALCDAADAVAKDDAEGLEAFRARWALADRAFKIEDWPDGVRLYSDAVPYCEKGWGFEHSFTLDAKAALAACLAGVQRSKPWDARDYEPAFVLFRGVADARLHKLQQALAVPGEGPLDELAAAATARRDIGITLFDSGASEPAKEELLLAHRLLCRNIARLGDPEILRTVTADLWEVQDAQTHMDLLRQTIKLTEDHFPERRETALSLEVDLAKKLGEAGKMQESVEIVQGALHESEGLAAPAPEPMIRLLHQAGTVFGLVGRIEEQERALRRAVELARQSRVDPSNTDVQGAALSLAVLVASKGGHDEAMELIQSSFAGEIHRLYRLRCSAEIQSLSGHFDEALEELDQAERIAGVESAQPTYGTQSGQLNTYFRRRQMASIHLAAGRAAKALAILEELRATLQVSPGSKAELSYVLKQLSDFHFSVMGDLAGAYSLSSESLERALELPGADNRIVQEARLQLGNVALFLGRLSEAESLVRLARDALARSDSSNLVDYVLACLSLAEILTAAGRLDEAQDANEEGLRAANALYLPNPALNGNLRASSGAILLAKGDPKRALPLLREGLAAMEPTGALTSDENNAYYRRKLLSALAALDTADELRAEVSVVVRNSKDRVNLMSILSARERGEAISGPLRQAEQIVVLRKGRADVISDRTLFEWLATLRAAGGPLEAVQLSGNDAEIRRLREDALHARQRVAAKSIHLDYIPGPAGERLLQEAVADCDAAERKLVEKLPRGSRFAWIDAGDLSIPLRAQDALGISIHRIRASPPEQAEDRYMAFVLDGKTQLRVTDLGPATAIEGKIQAWRKAVTGQERGKAVSAGGPDVPALGAALRAAVLDPLLQSTTQERIFLCLDDSLHTIPWDVLPAGPETVADKVGGPTKGKAAEPVSPAAGVKVASSTAKADELVGDRYRIDELSSFRDLLEVSKRQQRTPTLLALGNINYSAPGAAAKDAPPADRPLRGSADVFGHFDPLVASEDEVNGIVKYFNDTHTKRAITLTGENATKEALFAQAKDATYLHISTHGYFASEELTPDSARNPAMSSSAVTGFAPLSLCGLALAGANRDVSAREDVVGIATAEELAGLGLSACQLAVLSGCDTNLGVRRAGQDLASLKSALHAAGARNVVASLWDVPDAQTSKLMRRFYECLWKEHLPADEALWKAKSSFRGQPLAVWAGWVFSGVPESR